MVYHKPYVDIKSKQFLGHDTPRNYIKDVPPMDTFE